MVSFATIEEAWGAPVKGDSSYSKSIADKNSSNTQRSTRPDLETLRSFCHPSLMSRSALKQEQSEPDPEQISKLLESLYQQQGVLGVLKVLPAACISDFTAALRNNQKGILSWIATEDMTELVLLVVIVIVAIDGLSRIMKGGGLRS